NGYRLATGVGGSSQDPVSWRIDGSADGETWTTLDERTDFPVPTERQTYLAAMPLPASAAPVVVSFAASPVAVAPGGASSLSWTVTGADSVSIDNGVGPVAASGSTSVAPAATTTYTLSAMNGDGTTTATATVVVISGTAALFDFDDKTFQGWTDLTAPNTNNGPRNFTASGSAPDGLFLRDGTQSGAGAIEQVIQSSEDNAHPTLLLRSPEFRLNGSGDLTAWLNGGPGTGTVVDLTDATLPANSSEPGFQGVALRHAGTGTYVLAVRKTNEGGWQQVTLTAAQLAALDQNATYTLDLIDAGHGGWGWVGMDTVSIPGNFNHPPTFAGFAAGTPYETATEISLGKILAEASDPDGDALSVTAAGPASAQGGTAVLGVEGILYRPPAGFSGDDTFSVTITDTHGASVTGTVTVTVAGNSGVGSNPPTVTLLPGGDARIDFQGIPGRSYEVQRSTDLENWAVLSTVVAGPTGAVTYTDEDPPEGSAFYRLRKP
nr:Ig-like domain-containing protein [Akkermansiaceae bacterium]